MISGRLSFWIAVALLLVAAVLRIHEFATLPPGLHAGEITDIRVAEAVRDGNVSVFYDLGDDGRDGLYPIAVATVTTLTGAGTIGYRLVSLWAGMLLLALVFALGRRLAEPGAGLFALALLAFGFWPVLLSRMAIHMAIVPTLIAVILLSLAVALPVYPKFPNERGLSTAFVALGVSVGITLYAHPVGLVAALMSMAFILYVVRSRQPLSRRRQSYTSFALLLVLTLAIPYVTSSIRLGELNGATRLIAEFQGTSLQDIFDSLIGLAFLGDRNPAVNLPERPLFDPVSVVFMGIGLAAAWRRRRRPGYGLVLIAVTFLGPVALFSSKSTMFEAFAPLLPVLALLFGLGISASIVRLNRSGLRIGAGMVAVGAVALIAFTLWWTSTDLFTRWGDLPTVRAAYAARLGDIAHYADRTSPHTPTVICGWNPNQRPSDEQLSDAQLIDLMMNRQGAPVRWVDCMNGLVITDGGAQQQILLPNPTVLDNAHPQVRRWLSRGELIDPDIAAKNDIPADAALMLEVADVLPDALGVFTVTTPVNYAPETGESPPFAPPVSFGGNLTLLGYVPELVEFYVPGGWLVLPSYWRADGLVPRDLRLFTHVLSDPGAAPPANTDTISVLPSGLRDRDVLLQVTYVRMPESLPSGPYSISIGAYQDTSDARLDVLEEGIPRGTRLFLYDIQVIEPEPDVPAPEPDVPAPDGTADGGTG